MKKNNVLFLGTQQNDFLGVGRGTKEERHLILKLLKGKNHALQLQVFLTKENLMLADRHEEWCSL